MRRIPIVIAIGSTLSLLASASHALSFGRIDNSTVLGQPLDFAAVVNATSPDDAVGTECLAAEVFAGDNKLPQPLVRVRLEPATDGRSATVRVATTVRIDEPLVTVNLMIGCPVKLTRRFVAFVDPPVIALPRAMADAASGTGFAAPLERTADAPPTTAAPSSDSASSASRPRTLARPPRRPLNVASLVVPPRSKPAVGPARSSGTSASAAAGAAKDVARQASAPGLVLDSAPANGNATPISAAASAILAAELESYAQELAVERQRMKALEENVERLRHENETTKASLARVQSQLQLQTQQTQQARAAETNSRPPYSLYGLLALLAAIIAGLVWRQSRLKQQAAWWTDSNALASGVREQLSVPTTDAAVAVASSTPGLAPLVTPAPASAAPVFVPEDVTIAAVSPLSAAPLPMRDAPPPRPRGTVTPFDTQAMPPGSFVRETEPPAEPTRDLSVEELIDIEQQAEFFIVLGQDDAAIDLLMGVVRSSGGRSPMPYLKLLEIYRRLDQRDAYDRIRERFNQRFNGLAPPLEIDPAFGLDLTGYSDVLGQLQAAWSKPQDVAAMIERLVPRSPATAGTPFDLEAFGELLFLSRIARDLSDMESGEQGVDFLLPLDTDPLIQGPATLSLHAPYEPHKPLLDLTLDLDLDPLH